MKKPSEALRALRENTDIIICFSYVEVKHCYLRLFFREQKDQEILD